MGRDEGRHPHWTTVNSAHLERHDQISFFSTRDFKGEVDCALFKSRRDIPDMELRPAEEEERWGGGGACSVNASRREGGKRARESEEKVWRRRKKKERLLSQKVCWSKRASEGFAAYSSACYLPPSETLPCIYGEKEEEGTLKKLPLSSSSAWSLICADSFLFSA